MNKSGSGTITAHRKVGQSTTLNRKYVQRPGSKDSREKVMEEYRAESCILGKSVTLTDGECRYSGMVSDIDCGARIVLSCEDGETRVFGSGEATLKT